MIWTAYEIVLNLFEGFLFTWFVTKMLVKKRREYASSICTAYGFLIARWTDIVSIRANNRAVLHHGLSFF